MHGSKSAREHLCLLLHCGFEFLFVGGRKGILFWLNHTQKYVLQITNSKPTREYFLVFVLSSANNHPGDHENNMSPKNPVPECNVQHLKSLSSLNEQVLTHLTTVFHL